MVMSFENQTVLNYLLGNGFVYAFRKDRHKLGNDWINDGRTRPKIADVNITFVKDVKGWKDLEPFLRHSGFFFIEAWLEAIYDFGITEINGYLYRVSIRGVKSDAYTLKGQDIIGDMLRGSGHGS